MWAILHFMGFHKWGRFSEVIGVPMWQKKECSLCGKINYEDKLYDD